MNHNTAKDIAEIVGLGLGTNYMRERGNVRQHPDKVGGIIPRLSSTGDPTRDLTIEAGRFASVVGIGHWIVIPLWKVWAIGWIAGLYVLGHNVLGIQHGTTSVFIIGGLIWAAAQIWFWRLWCRILDGRSPYTRAQRRSMRRAKRAYRRQQRRNRSKVVTTQVVNGRVVLVPVPVNRRPV